MNFRLCALSIATYVALSCMPGVARCDDVLFWDDFEDGTSDNWQIVEYGFDEVVDGSYCLHTYCEP